MSEIKSKIKLKIIMEILHHSGNEYLIPHKNIKINTDKRYLGIETFFGLLEYHFDDPKEFEVFKKGHTLAIDKELSLHVFEHKAYTGLHIPCKNLTTKELNPQLEWLYPLYEVGVHFATINHRGKVINILSSKEVIDQFLYLGGKKEITLNVLANNSLLVIDPAITKFPTELLITPGYRTLDNNGTTTIIFK